MPPLRSGHSKLAYFLLVTMVAFLTLFGLFSVRYNAHAKKRFVFSKAYLAYTLTLVIGFTYVYTRQIYQDYMQSQLNLSDAVKLYSYMNITVAIINFVTQMLKSKQAARLLGQVPLFALLDEFESYMQVASIRRSVAMTLVKAIGFQLTIAATLLLQQRHNEPQLSWLWCLYKWFPIIVSNMLGNCFFGGTIIVKALLEALNVCLRAHVQQLNFMQRQQQSRYYRIQRFCTLADELDWLAIRYRIVCTKSKEFMDLVGLSLVLSLLCHVLGLTVGFFNQYYAVANSFIEDQPYDVFGALTNLVFLVISFAEITLLAQLSHDVLTETELPGFILHKLTLEQVDWRYQQAVDAFSLQLSCIEYKMMPLGLFELKMSLMSAVLSAVASFLLILIQNDLSQRVKAK